MLIYHIHSHLPIYLNIKFKWIPQMNRQVCMKNSVKYFLG